MDNMLNIFLIKKKPFFKRNLRITKRILITKLLTPVVTEINVYNDKKVVNVKANIPFRFLNKIKYSNLFFVLLIFIY